MESRQNYPLFIALLVLLNRLSCTGGSRSGEQAPMSQNQPQHSPTASPVPGPAPGPWTKVYVQQVGRMAYIWGRPLAVNHRETHDNVTEPVMVNGIGVAPVNQLVMWHDYVDPSERMLGERTRMWCTG